ncbi:unnamed protein product [Caenorhabditis sp. 36 PRJEB53466]|nr:unnamed protein product [Caenorhabditis sp. 36 PRJEB53466]
MHGLQGLLFVMILVLGTGVEGYGNLPMGKRQVDMRSFSLYDLPDDYHLAPNEDVQRHQHLVNPKPGYITAFYPIYDFGRRR